MRQTNTNALKMCFARLYLRAGSYRNSADEGEIGLGALLLPIANGPHRTHWVHQHGYHLPRRISLRLRWQGWNHHALGSQRVEAPVLPERW